MKHQMREMLLCETAKQGSREFVKRVKDNTEVNVDLISPQQRIQDVSLETENFQRPSQQFAKRRNFAQQNECYNLFSRTGLPLGCATTTQVIPTVK